MLLCMETRPIGSLQASVIGLGCNNFGVRLDAAKTRAVVEAALREGINFFDTADVYGQEKSEVFLGEALAPHRKDVLIATKFGSQLDEQRKGAHPAYVKRALEASLQRLGTDYVDLYQIHRPDPTVPIADTLGALDELVRAGKTREIGCSNFSLAQLREAVSVVSVCGARFVSLQNEYNLLVREPELELLPYVATQQIGFLPFFPLASGLLTGKYRAGEASPEGARLSDPTSPRAARFLSTSNVARAEKLRSFAEQRGHSLLELAFSWLRGNRAVASVIAGATQVEQVRANAAAASWQLTADELGEVDRLSRA
jgi:aryl-alcohol dehydrogenase-like predicted oxidoreductase